MQYLVYTTLIWAFSFSFIGEFLSGKVDSYFAILIRVLCASIVFIPFTKFKQVPNILRLKISGLGAIQIGLMYIFYYNSFLFLSVPEVVLFTIFTPFFVTLIYDLFKKRFRSLYLLSVGVAILGAFVINFTNVNTNFIIGFLMVQGANLCFAIGQCGYKKVLEQYPNIKQQEIFGYFHFGSLAVGLVAFFIFANFNKISPDLTQWSILIWLGVVASGLGYFMWNKGATMVDSGVLAIMNNALIPVALVVNLAIWHKPIHFTSFIIGSILIFGSLYLHKYFEQYYAKFETANFN